MSDQQTNFKLISKRFPLRLVPEDKLTMERTLGLTVFNQKSAMVRAALTVFKQVWDAKSSNNRIILRDENSRRQYGVLITRASHEFAEKDDLFLESKVANKDEIFEIRLSSGDVNLLEELIEAGAAATFSQAIRRALALYAHVVAKQGYKLAAQTPSGDVLYLNVPGVRRPIESVPVDDDPHKPLFVIIDDNVIMRRFWATNLAKEGASIKAFPYDKSLTLDANFAKAEAWAKKLVDKTKPRKVGFVVDLCWAVRKDLVNDQNKEEWGIFLGRKGESVAGYAGFKFIEDTVTRGWAQGIRFVLVTKFVSEIEVRQNLTNEKPRFAERLAEFEARVSGFQVEKTFYGNKNKPDLEDVREVLEKLAA